jgi:hypothetical protein
MDVGVILEAARETLAREGRHLLPGRKHVTRIPLLQIDRNLAGLWTLTATKRRLGVQLLIHF